MKKIIYSIFIENSQKNIDEKHINSFLQFQKNYHKIYNRQKEYADICGAEYRVFGNDERWSNFKEKYQSYEFDVINLYKLHLFEELSKDFDSVLYFDFDVLPNTDVPFFDNFDLNKICVRSIDSTLKDTWSHKNKSYMWKVKTLDRYSEHIKCLCKKAMLLSENVVSNNFDIVNTAILGGNKDVIGKVKFTDKLDNMIKILETVKEEMFYGKDITDMFFPNNEVFFHYLLERYDIEYFNLPEEWHKIYYTKTEINEDVKKYKMIHLINKRFDECLSYL